jgi:radical SAM superfamily enzyme YgiQ (UPF0313 family)
MIAPPKSLLYLSGQLLDMPDVERKMLDILAYPDFNAIHKNLKHPPVFFGMDPSEVLKQVGEYSPDLIAVTSTANYYFRETVEVINLLKSGFPEVTIVAGGPDLTNDYEAYFREAAGLDFAITHEGEIPFRRLVEALKEGGEWSGIPGLICRDGIRLKVNPPQPYCETIDQFTADYSIVDFETYFALNRRGYHSRLTFQYPGSDRSIDLITSRGCPYGCTFCCIDLHMGRKVRTRTPENVLSEMELLISQHGIRNFHFEDDHLLADLPRFKTILRGIIEKQWLITWDTPNGVRADCVDEELVILARQSGCTYFIFAPESGSQRVLDEVIGKKIQLEAVTRACELCFRYQIDTLAFFIFGLPGEKPEELEMTYQYAVRLFREYNTTPVFQLWRPYRNTPMEMQIRKSDLVSDRPVLELHRKFGIPFAMFYSRVFEDDRITLELLSGYFKRYMKDAVSQAFKNWLRIASRKPGALIFSLMMILGILLKTLFHPSKRRFLLEQYITGPGLLPFSILNGRGRKRQK